MKKIMRALRLKEVLMPLWGHPRRNVEREEDKREKHFDITMDDWMTVINTGHIFCGKKGGHPIWPEGSFIFYL